MNRGPVLERHGEEQGVLDDPRVVHQDVETAVLLADELEHGVDRARVRHVRLIRARAAALAHDLLFELFGRVARAPVVDDHRGSQAREGQAARAPDPAPASRDQRHLPGEIDLHAVRSREARSSTPA